MQDTRRRQRYSRVREAKRQKPVMTAEHWVDLICHPSMRSQAVRAIRVSARRSANGELQLTFRLEGDVPRVQIPMRDASRVGKELWRHTCFETFIAVEGQPAYHEFNFAPSKEWAAYAFRSYRDGDLLSNEMMCPNIAVRSTATSLELDAVIRLDALSALHQRAALRIGLAAVVEASDGISYWALRHPAGKPDFHYAGGFALLLEALGSETSGA
jgi:hypothetical protein